MSSKPTNRLTSRLSIFLTASWVALLLSSAPLMAAEDSARTSRSITFSKGADFDKTAKDVQLSQTDADVLPSLEKQGFRSESMVMASVIETTEYVDSGEMTIYDVSSELISDFDFDGYYHRYSVAIDADTVYDTSYIYVRLYLSYEGGPWNYYASSDVYRIHGDSEMDTFIIETELADGYPPGYYDVRIELYDADNDRWMTSYGSYDDASLRALPLEDSYYDDSYYSSYPPETEVVVAAHGGSVSWLMLTFLLSIMGTRLIAIRSGQTMQVNKD